MANNYTQVSVILVVPKEQADWFQEKISDENFLLQEAGCEYVDINIEDTEGGLWLSGDSFDVHVVSTVIQHMFKHFNSNKHFVIQWADTCDKMRVDEFGGGSVYIDKDQIVYSTELFDNFVRGLQNGDKIPDNSKGSIQPSS